MLYTPQRPSCLWRHQRLPKDSKILDLARSAPLVPSYCIVRSSAQMALQPLMHRLYTKKGKRVRVGHRDWHFKLAVAKNTIISHTFFGSLGSGWVVTLGHEKWPKVHIFSKQWELPNLRHETQHVRCETVQLQKNGKLWGMICFNVLSNLLYNLL